MKPRFILVAALCLAASLSAVWADDKSGSLPEGNWIMTYHGSPIAGTRLAIFKVENTGGKLSTTDSTIADRTNFPVESISVKGSDVVVAFKGGYTFEGKIDPRDGKTIRGSFGNEGTLFRADLTSTEEEKLSASSVPMKPPAEMAEIQKLRTAPNALVLKLRAAKDDEEKAAIQKEIAELRKEAETKIPALYHTIIEKHADTPAGFEAANVLLATAAKDKATPEEVAKLIKTVETFAILYGKRFEADTMIKTADTLARQKGLETAAKDYIAKAYDTLPKDAPATMQARLLKSYKTVLTASNDQPKLKEIVAELAKLEERLDKEYLEKVPPFKPTPYAGRAEKGDRVAVMELFTGAQCPPCVAADVAFDALEKAYKPTDLILLQYHLHIPGPDPLTNTDTIARASYYKVNSTPSTFFSGKAGAGGGGGMSNSEGKYAQYKKIIDPILEQEAGVTLTGSVTHKDEKIDMKVALEGLKEPGDEVVVRFVLVEEAIRYTGSNGLRFHHQVVRALPGGAAGVKVKDLKDNTATASVDLAELRKSLTDYLTKTNETRAYPNADRPLDLKHLRVIALVQDDETKKILQAKLFEVEGAK